MQDIAGSQSLLRVGALCHGRCAFLRRARRGGNFAVRGGHSAESAGSVEVAFLSYEAFARIFLGQYDKAAELAQAALRVPNCQYWANAHLAAALGHLSKNDEARNAVAELLRRKPDFSCRYAEEHLFYLESRVQLEHYLEGLRRAGVPA